MMNDLPTPHRDCSGSVPSTPCEGEPRKLSRREQSRCGVGYAFHAGLVRRPRLDSSVRPGQGWTGLGKG